MVLRERRPPEALRIMEGVKHGGEAGRIRRKYQISETVRIAREGGVKQGE